MEMSNKYMKTYSTSPITGEMEVKTTIGYHFSPTMTTIFKNNKINAGESVEKLEHLYIVDGNAKWYSCYGKVWQFLKNLNIELPYNPTILLLGIYTKELKVGAQTNTCIPMSIVVLFLKP